MPRKEDIDRAHDEGQKDGSEGRSGIVIGWNSATQPSVEEREAYNAGVENGWNNPSHDDND